LPPKVKSDKILLVPQNGIEKLEIAKERGEAQIKFLGACRCHRHRRRQNASELFSVYAAGISAVLVVSRAEPPRDRDA